jgi:hypothetical protein
MNIKSGLAFLFICIASLQIGYTADYPNPIFGNNKDKKKNTEFNPNSHGPTKPEI